MSLTCSRSFPRGVACTKRGFALVRYRNVYLIGTSVRGRVWVCIAISLSLAFNHGQLSMVAIHVSVCVCIKMFSLILILFFLFIYLFYFIYFFAGVPVAHARRPLPGCYLRGSQPPGYRGRLLLPRLHHQTLEPAHRSTGGLL